MRTLLLATLVTLFCHGIIDSASRHVPLGCRTGVSGGVRVVLSCAV